MSSLQDLIDSLEELRDEIEEDLGTPPVDPVPATVKATIAPKIDSMESDCVEIYTNHCSPPGAASSTTSSTPTTIAGCLSDMQSEITSLGSARNDEDRRQHATNLESLCVSLEGLCGIT
jgi:hypothetical protein